MTSNMDGPIVYACIERWRKEKKDAMTTSNRTTKSSGLHISQLNCSHSPSLFPRAPFTSLPSSNTIVPVTQHMQILLSRPN